MKLHPADAARVWARLPLHAKSVLQTWTRAGGASVVVAGGFVRSLIAREHVSDVDLFLHEDVDQESIKNSLLNVAAQRSSSPGAIVHETPQAITVRVEGSIPVQIVTCFRFTSPVEVIESFDFTVCQAAAWWVHGRDRATSIVAPSFYQDLAARRLVYARPEKDSRPGGSVLRLRKFLGRGYRIRVRELAPLLARFVESLEPGDTVEREIVRRLVEVDPSAFELFAEDEDDDVDQVEPDPPAAGFQPHDDDVAF